MLILPDTLFAAAALLPNSSAEGLAYARPPAIPAWAAVAALFYILPMLFYVWNLRRNQRRHSQKK